MNLKEHNKKVAYFREKVQKNPDKVFIIPNDVYFEVVYGEKLDPSILKDDFNEKGEYIGEYIEE